MSALKFPTTGFKDGDDGDEFEEIIISLRSVSNGYIIETDEETMVFLEYKELEKCLKSLLS